MAARPGLFACLVLFIVLLLPMMKAGWLCGHLVGEDGTGCFDFLWFVVYTFAARRGLLVLSFDVIGRICCVALHGHFLYPRGHTKR